ncbi:hypothetical protein J1N35_024805 [Gossypium stocksii]|uniref:Uncharacterized protein n=1 Tax=Gossypium stocksii TaxID=47602 RepID=A0A9D3V521_9ROSI|nr:hypothetical protein J1N35_024805 [Gossypium stocksii]
MWSGSAPCASLAPKCSDTYRTVGTHHRDPRQKLVLLFRPLIIPHQLVAWVVELDILGVDRVPEDAFSQFNKLLGCGHWDFSLFA